MTEFEKAFKNMTPAQRKKAGKFVDEQMGMPKKRKKPSATKKSSKK